jgi:hypothetical protein
MDGKTFVIVIIAIVTIASLLKYRLRAMHGYPLQDEWSDKSDKPSRIETDRQLALISNENADLKGKIVRLEERVAVLERIATDRSTSLADEIEALR